MRDEFEDDYDVADPEAPAGWRARMVDRVSTWLGAGLAVSLVLGGVVWTYRLVERDASEIPVIHASLSPTKVQPNDPGGAATPHQGIKSYAAGQGLGLSPTVAFAPPPERPAEEDVAMGMLRAPDGTIAQPASLTTTDAAPSGPSAAPAASPFAPSRPADLAARMDAAKKATSLEEKLAASAAASQVQIQLGAFPSRDFTSSEWDRIYKANEDVLSGRALVVQSTISGGQRFFRLRAGPFKDRIEAQNICRALQSRGQDCLVAVNG